MDRSAKHCGGAEYGFEVRVQDRDIGLHKVKATRGERESRKREMPKRGKAKKA